MARDYQSVNSEYYESSSAVLTSLPCSLSAWINPDQTNQACEILNIGASANSSRWLASLQLWSDATLYANSYSTTAFGEADGGAYTSGTWQHIGGSFDQSSRYAYNDGVQGAEDTTAIGTTFTGVDRTTIGAKQSNGLSNYTNGIIAELAAWNTVLTASQFATLAQGYSALLVQPENLVVYVPAYGAGITGNELALVGQHTWVPNGTISWREHPPIIYPQHQMGAAVINIPTGIPAVMHHRRQIMEM